MSLLVSVEQCRLSQLFDCVSQLSCPTLSAVSVVWFCPLFFFFFPFIFKPLTSQVLSNDDVAVLCPEITQVRQRTEYLLLLSSADCGLLTRLRAAIPGAEQ